MIERVRNHWHVHTGISRDFHIHLKGLERRTNNGSNRDAKKRKKKESIDRWVFQSKPIDRWEIMRRKFSFKCIVRCVRAHKPIDRCILAVSSFTHFLHFTYCIHSSFMMKLEPLSKKEGPWPIINREDELHMKGHHLRDQNLRENRFVSVFLV